MYENKFTSRLVENSPNFVELYRIPMWVLKLTGRDSSLLPLKKCHLKTFQRCSLITDTRTGSLSFRTGVTISQQNSCSFKGISLARPTNHAFGLLSFDSILNILHSWVCFLASLKKLTGPELQDAALKCLQPDLNWSRKSPVIVGKECVGLLDKKTEGALLTKEQFFLLDSNGK